MPGSTRKLPVWLPILVLLIAMSSIQSGASLAKSLFPLVGAPRNGASSGVGNAYPYRLFQTLAFAFCQRAAAAFTVLWSVAGRDELSILSVDSDGAVGYCGRAGIYRSSGGRAVFIPAAGRFYLGRTGCAWALVPAAIRARYVSRRSYRGRVSVGAGACWAVYILTGQRAGAEHGPATVAVGSLIAAIIFVPIGAVQAGDALWHWSILPLGLAVAVLRRCLIHWK